jgi:uncharacterized protein (TIGR03086 family)
MSDAVDRYKGLADTFGARIEGTPDDKWGAQSPCEDWTARDVAAHVIEGQRRIAAGFDGTEAQPLGADEDPKAAWRESYATLLDRLQDSDNLQKQVAGPMGPMPAEMLIGRIMASDILVHTWDLARATGQDETLDQDAVQHAFDGLRPMDAMIRRPGVFGPAVEPPEGADTQTQFLCFLGRHV